MKTKQNINTALASLMVLSLLTSPIFAEDAKSGKMTEIERTIAVQRATQAGIWAMPALTTYGFTRGIIQDLGGKYNDVVANSHTFGSRHALLTTNDVTPMMLGPMTTAEGPMVVEIPPTSDKIMIFGTFVDPWMRPIVDAGLTGEDQGKGGKYLFLPHDYEGEVPSEGYLVFQLEGHGFQFGLRLISRNDGTIEDAAAYSHTIKAYHLADAANPPATTYHDVYGKDWNTLPYYDLRMFEDINAIIQDEPARERDKAMIGMLREIGIERGKPFAPDAEMEAVFTEAGQLAYAYLQNTFVTPGKGLVPLYGGDSYWMSFNVPIDQAKTGFPFEDDGVPLIDLRATSYFYLSYFPKKLGPATFYTVGLLDNDGNQLNGTDTYKLNVTSDAPARDFWSVIVYSMETKAFIRDVEIVGKSRLQLDEMNVNDDGSVDVYFGPEAPKGQESNWVPTGGDDFFLVFCLYGPEEAAFDKSWQLGEVEKVK
jgi:hypothetical protein